MKKSAFIGLKFDDFLTEEGIYDDVQAAAIKNALSIQLRENMKRKKLTKTILARRMRTSRSAIDRLFSPDNYSVTLNTLARAASALGKKLSVRLT